MSEQSINQVIKRIVAGGPFEALTDFDDKTKPKLDRVTGRQVFGQSATLFLKGARPVTVNIQTLNSTPSGAEEGDDLDVTGLGITFYSSQGKVGVTFTAEKIYAANASSSKSSSSSAA